MPHHSARPNLIGQRFGRLIVIEDAGRTPNRLRAWLCRCDCGKLAKLTTSKLQAGYNKSCGCLRRNAENLAGQRFGRLVAIRRRGYDQGKRRWSCRCDCGNKTVVTSTFLRNGSIRSCGCLIREVAPELFGTHGMVDVPEYQIWGGIKARCLRKSCASYKNYGARGITICPRWRDSFEAFYEDMGPRPSPYHEIDRIDNDGDYEPSNCRWATREEQNNNRRTNKFLEFDGKRQTMSQWSREIGIKSSTIQSRLDMGWSVEKALTTPVGPQGNRRGKCPSLKQP